ncbi:MAG: molybdopterin cofactor-binding domain-containing protein, partial [Gemmatimonadota bacterium]
DPLESLRPGGPDARLEGNANGHDGVERIKWTDEALAAAGEGQLPMGDAVEEWSYGDVEGGLANAALVLDESFTTASTSHHSMEPRTAMAYWQGGKCFLYGSSQSQSFVVPGLASYIGIPPEDLVFIGEYCGGGFGSKASAYPLMTIPAHMSKKVGRPVMMRISRAEENYVGFARSGFQGRLRMGFRADGRLQAVDLYIVQDNGPNAGFHDADAAADAVSLLYTPQAMRYRGIQIYTNTPPRSAQRGPGQNQMACAIEPLIDKAARELGIDRVAIRRINAPDSDSPIGGDRSPVTSAYMREALDLGATRFDWQARLARSGVRNGSKVRSVGVGQAFHPAGNSGLDGLVRLTPDGILHIHTG